MYTGKEYRNSETNDKEEKNIDSKLDSVLLTLY